MAKIVMDQRKVRKPERKSIGAVQQQVTLPGLIRQEAVAATPSGAEAQSALKAVLTVSTGHLVSLSEQQFVSCGTTDSWCDGGCVHNAFLYAENNSLCRCVFETEIIKLVQRFATFATHACNGTPLVPSADWSSQGAVNPLRNQA